jgi:hypothetical protein
MTSTNCSGDGATAAVEARMPCKRQTIQQEGWVGSLSQQYYEMRMLHLTQATLQIQLMPPLVGSISSAAT